MRSENSFVSFFVAKYFFFRGYTGPAPCSFRGAEYCSGDRIAGVSRAGIYIQVLIKRFQGGSVFVEQVCDDGTVFFINKITGLKFQKGRLSGSEEKAKKKAGSGKKQVRQHRQQGNHNNIDI